MTKCPYVPPHPWNLDFPHLMLRAKAIKFKKGEVRFRDKLLSSHRRARQARRHSGRRADGQRGEQRTAPRERRWRRCSACTTSAAAALRRQQVPLPRAREPARIRCEGRRAHARQGGDLRHLLRQLQRARHRPRPARDPRAQRDPLRARREGSLLRHAQARAGRSGRGGAAQGSQHPGAREVRARGLRDPHRGAVLHADVQAGAAADVPGRCRRARRSRRRCSIRSSTSCCATRTAC